MRLLNRFSCCLAMWMAVACTDSTESQPATDTGQMVDGAATGDTAAAVDTPAPEDSTGPADTASPEDGSSADSTSSADTAPSDTAPSDTTASDPGTPSDTEPSVDTGSEPASSVKSTASYEVKVTSGLAYAKGLISQEWGGSDTKVTDLLLDVYEPIGAPGALKPVLLIVHGGGFVGGSPTQGQLVQWANYYAARGFVCFSIDYRVAKHHGTLPANWPADAAEVHPGMSEDQLKALYPSARDTKAAVRWIRAHAEEYGIHSDHIAAMGGSAGAFLVVMLGVSDEADYRDELSLDEDPTLSTTNLDQSAKVQTVIDLWGATAHLDAMEVLNGVDRFDVSDAPVAIMHGVDDEAVPFVEAEQIKAKYDGTGVPYIYHPLQAGHGAWNEKIEGQNLAKVAFDFIVEQQALTLEP